MTDANSIQHDLNEAISDLGSAAALNVLNAHSETVASTVSSTVPSNKTLKSRALMWPTISRGERVRKDSTTGRILNGDLTLQEQVEADRKWWATNPTMRRQCLPILVADKGVLDHAWIVSEWVQGSGNKWSADIERPVSNRELIDLRSPYLIGDPMPTEGYGAFWPVAVDIDGSVYRAGELVKRWDAMLGRFRSI